MILWTDVAEPQELTELARRAAQDREQRNEFNLGAFLPNEHSLSHTVTFEVGDNGYVEAAEYRAYDAETPIGGRGEGGRRVTFELPPLGQKRRVSEYEQLRHLGDGGEAAMRNALGRAAVQRGEAVADRIELERGRVLVSGKAAINENGFIVESEFGRDQEMTVTAGTKWGEASADPVQDILDWQEAYVDKNGEAPAYIVASTKAISALSKFSGFLPKDSVRRRASFDEINALLDAEGLPTLVKYDRRVRVNAKSERVIPEETLLFLPGDDAGLGKTFWGTTLESLDQDYSLQAEERPGIVAGAFKTNDPIAAWVKASAIGMPVLANANLAMAATVL
ncbi:major capsid protein [Corynebacterium sp. MSK041]|uniref:major capsid protein n=1 Tax=Corynebacterium sp. MSK041 TaxID=3050194 RepID=UPI0025513812|nr:major capsid protein [Corynebacterium sp. MSK041]MDK8794234.1 major capsid protein [Corynebacterium sp. MSK041]